MAKIKYDITGSDPDKAVSGADFEPAPVGVYIAELAELNTGYSRNDDGTEDKKRPRLEGVWRLLSDKDGEDIPNYGNVWSYFPFTENTQWKLDQLLQAIGAADKKKGRKGTLDTKKYAASADGEDTKHPGAKVLLRVRKGTNRDGDYRAEYGGAWALEEGAGKATPTADEDEEEFAGAVDDSGEEITEEEIDAMSGKELKALIKEQELELDIPKGSKLSAVRELVKEALFEEGEDEDEDEEEDWGDDEDDDEAPF